MKTNKKVAGFTLIELLVVIAIIGTLSSIVLVSLSGARVKARDAKRLQDMKTFQTALELYASDNGRYPITYCPTVHWTSFDSPAYSPGTLCSVVGGTGSNTLTQELAPYVASLTDPKNLGGDSGYLYIGNGTGYCILFWRTPENLNNFPASYVPSNRCSGWDSNGQCTSSPYNSIYQGTGSWAAGC